MDKRNIYLFRKKEIELKRSEIETKKLLFIVIPFLGVGFFHAITIRGSEIAGRLFARSFGTSSRERRRRESTIPEREIRYETDDNEFKFASTKKASARYSRNSTRYSSTVYCESILLFILPLIMTDSEFSSA